MKKRNILITMLAFVCILVVGVGFAALTRNLNIGGNVILTPGDFSVKFVAGTGYTVSTTTTEGDTAIISDVILNKSGEGTIIYVDVKNFSTDYIAKIDEADFEYELTTSTGGNLSDIELQFGSQQMSDEGIITLNPNASAKIAIVISLKKAQLDDEHFTLNFRFEATAIPT